VKHRAALKAAILTSVHLHPSHIPLKSPPDSAETREPASARAGFSAVCLSVLLLAASTHVKSQLRTPAQYDTGNSHCVSPVDPPPLPDSLVAAQSTRTDSTETDLFPNESLQGSVELSADSANNDPDDPEVILLNGTISIQHRDGELTAENAQFDSRTNIATVDGDMSYRAAGLEVQSTDATLNVTDGTFELGESGYELGSGEVVAQGRARRITRDDLGSLRLKDATYTTCLLCTGV